MEERLELMCERIYEMTEDEIKDPAFREYFSEVRGFFLDVMEKSLPEQDHLYRMLGKYEESFLNPGYAVSRLGKIGGILSALYADIYSLPVYKLMGRDDVLTIFMELFVQVHTNICLDLRSDEDPYEEVLADISMFYRDYLEVFAKDSCLDTIDPERDFWSRIVKEADLSSCDYLYDYGLVVGENEKRIWKFLNDLPMETIKKMADTFTEGYRKGFEMTRKDIRKKNVVGIEYPLGFERVIRVAIENFKEMGFEVTTPPKPLLSVTGRGSKKRGVHSLSEHRQFMYDHKDDKGYYYDKAFVTRRLEVISDTYEKNKELASKYGGPAVIEEFGNADFKPENKPQAYHYSKKQDELNVYEMGEVGIITNRYIPGSEYSFTIISFPIPEIGDRFEEIFERIMEINTLDYDKYLNIQSKIIDALDEGERVYIKGTNGNETDLTVSLHTLNNKETETNFENCVADVNIPVGEVFTSPVLKGTNGILHVSYVFLGDYKFENLKLKIEDGMIADYSCSNFDSVEENKKLIFENILYRHKTLPMGEFAIGTNTLAYASAREFGIEDKLPILIAEKTGPHFAFGDTCYSHAEEVAMYNPNGKEVIARDNECSALRKEDPGAAYFNCHTDITVPFDELGAITVIERDGHTRDIILDGKFVLPGTEELNVPLNMD